MALLSSRKLNPSPADNARRPTRNWNEVLACTMYGRGAADPASQAGPEERGSFWIEREPPRLRLF